MLIKGTSLFFHVSRKRGVNFRNSLKFGGEWLTVNNDRNFGAKFRTGGRTAPSCYFCTSIILYLVHFLGTNYVWVTFCSCIRR